MTVVVVVLFALAAAVGVGSPAERELGRLDPAPVGRRGSAASVPVLLLLTVVMMALMGPRAAGWVVVGCVVTGTAVWVVRGMRAERLLVRRRDESARAVRTMFLLLRSGQIPTCALQDAASDCPVLVPAALTGHLGGDVAGALREAGELPGRHGLLRLAAAWHVSEQTGAPIAAVLTRVSENLRQERHVAGVVAAELAAARASGRIMALLPFVGIGIGVLVGADPLGFLFGSPLGEMAFLAGTLLAAGGVVWTETISRSGAAAGGRGG